MRPDQRVRGVPDGEVSQRALRAWRARGWRRWRLAVAGEAALWALAAGVATAAVVGRPLAAVIATAAVLAWRVLADATFRDVRRMLHATEEAWPALGNALMAWHEADRGMLRVSPVFRDRLAMQARGALPDAWPAPRTRHEWTAALAALALAVALAVSMPYLRGVTDAERHEPVEAPGTEVQPESVSVIYRITPPAYTRRPPVEAEDVATIEAVVGSGLEATLRGLPAGATADIAGDPLPLAVGTDGHATAATAVRESGLLTVADAEGRPLVVTAIQAVPDRPPLVRITAPGRDIRTSDVASRIPVDVDASDDIGLATLRVRYTHVTGSGETFEFVDGELPVEVRRSADAWRARGTLDLSALGLAPGDSLVYWAVATDARPGTDGLAESERYLVEVPRPGQAAAGDFSLPDTEHRYALSQRMVIQLTERLRERRPQLPADEYLSEAQGLAAHQRRVRAEFVFLMGGEVVDEVEEAEHSHEVEAGRLDNSGQRELLEAVRQMALAEQRLTDADLDAALPFEYRALEALQAAFGKARYIMRTLPVRVAIDPARRGSGDLSLASSAAWARTPLPPGSRGQGRDTLLALLDLTPGSAPASVRRVADALLALDGERAEWLGAVQALTAAFAAGVAPDERRRVLDTTAAALRARLAATSPHAISLPLPIDGDEAGLASTGGHR